MTTLLHLNQTLLDVQEALARERRFGHDTCHSLMASIKLLREGLDGMERDIKSYFEDRDRSISAVLGSSQPFTTVIDQAPVMSIDADAAVPEPKKGSGKKTE